MAKLLVTQPSCIFAVIIFILLVFSVGLLVFVLKGQLHHESSLEGVAVHHEGSSGSPFTHSPIPQTASTPLPDSQADSAVHTTLPEETPWLDFRLPKNVIPVHYDLLLHPDLDSDTFTGTVAIAVNVTSETRHFVVHAYRLSILDVHLLDVRQGKAVALEKQFVYSPHEYFVVATDERQSPGPYRIKFGFSGTLNGTIIGFYKSRYKNNKNETRYLATSKFQPTYARRAFPCFDEPSFKSTFSVSLVHDEGHVALSNMPAQVTEPYSTDPTFFVTKFQQSVPMVTYLACFIVCDFQFQGTTTSSGKPFRVYTTPDQVNLTTYALNFGSRVLEYFEKYFGIDYPLPKQDMVAIPDFSSGAMEHWGVITFRETNLLYDPDNSSPQNLQRISSVISHEMTHMWFGNLVTMSWWDDLWLNEGFASYVEYKGVDEQHPQWDTLSQFVTEELQPVMNLDSTMSSHPIVQPVLHPDEITEIFDDISYGKGASVLRMLEFFVGENNFRTGISNFLKKFQFKNARTGDLWEELSTTCGLQGNRSIASIMKTWTEQMGFPYVTVSRKSSSNASFVSRQRRFLKNEAMQPSHASTRYVWSVPLSYTTGDGASGIVWIHDEEEHEFSVPASPSSWVKFNVNQTGFYLVNYEEEEWKRFTQLLITQHETLSPSDRSNLLFDSFLLAEAGHVPLDRFLSMSKYLVHENHLIPWETAYASFVYFCQMLESTEINVMLKGYIRDLTNGLYKKLGWKTSENHLDNLLRTTIIGLACHSGNQECLNDAAELFQNWTRGQETPSSLRSLVYNFGMAEIGREEHWNYMWNRYLVEESPAQKKTIMNGLAHVRTPYLILRYLDYAMDVEKVRSQDFFTILSYIAGNPVGRPLVWNFIREKWTVLVDRFTLNNRYLGNAVKKICSYFTTERELQEMRHFFAKYPDAGAGKRRRQQALEVVQNNIRWIRSHAHGVKDWLEAESPAPWYSPRLPPHTIPEHYDLHLHPDLEAGRFTGHVAIWVSLRRPSDRLLVHAGADLNVSRTQVWSVEQGGAQRVELDEVFPYEENEYLVLRARETLPVGNYKLFFEFEGPLTLSLKGIYRSSYLDLQANERRPLVTTQFAANYARRAFPCFDEPAFRSTFNVSVLHNSSLFALSNAPVQNVSAAGEGVLVTRFEKTLPMVTYLLSVVVCDFPFRETIAESGVKVRVYTAPPHIERTGYALSIASKILTHFEKYFGIPFPLKKLDLVAIPDITYFGMENWGLITFKEEAILCDNASSLAKRYHVATLISHELAHMWFGDLVTMSWWDDLWLNEGFATYMSRKGSEHVEPDIDQENSIGSSRLIDAMISDRTIHAHPIVQRIERVNFEIYDEIAYSKGSSILRMLENYIGEDFREGVSSYLTKHAFGNAKTSDLWDALTTTSKQGLEVGHIMDTWTRQINYPYVSVDCYGNDTCAVQQYRFLEDPDTAQLSGQQSPYNYVWHIPLTYRTSNSSDVFHLLLNSSEKVSLPVPKREWIKFNADFSGYYSVNYDRQGWERILQALHNNHTAFSPADRVNLIYDAFSLAGAGHVGYDVPLQLIGYLRRERYHGAWQEALSELSNLKRYFRTDREVKEIIKEYVRSLSKDLLKKYAWDDSGDYSERELRKVILNAACDSRNQECMDTAAQLYKQWSKGSKMIPDTKQVVYRYGIRAYSNEQSWGLMWNKFLKEEDPNEKQMLLDALTNVRNTTLLERLMRFSRNDTLIRKHDCFAVLKKIAQNPKGFPLITQLLFTRWHELTRDYGREETEEFAARVFKGYTTEKDLLKVRDFYQRQKGDARQGTRSHSQALYSISRNIHWLKKHRQTVRDWLLANVYMPWRDIRLPRHVQPTRYDLLLRPNISTATFEGEQTIRLNITMPTDYLLLHESGLKIHSPQLVAEDGSKNVLIVEEFSYRKNEYHVILFGEEVPAGVYQLKMEFSGKFSPDGSGMHRYQYQHRKTGDIRQLLATRFEATYARRVFPCFDEPSFKSRFRLSIVHTPNVTAVSNMPEEERINITDGLLKTVFMESEMMSTYLLFCVVSDFGYLEADYKGKPVRAYAPPDRLEEASHGLNMTLRLLDTLEKFFDVPYVLPKLDSVCIPGYAVPGMEHWGVISYNEDRFLVNGSLTERRRILFVDRVIAHEVVHQWFGNLVTMKWWDDLWLNEGVSTLIMYMPLKQYYPSINEADVRKMSRMMCPDSSVDSHPIVRKVSTPDEIEDAFDVISYEKGAAVMKMLQHIMKDDFRKGLSNYLKKYAYMNAETKDLWVELDNATSIDVDVSSLMDTWTRQMGFPYVELTRNGSSLTATQHWFSRNVNASRAEEVALRQKYGFIWKIPLTYKNLGTGNEHTLWLQNKTAIFQINSMKEDVLKFNPGFIGFYIIKYDTSDWERLGRMLLENHEAVDVADRYNLLHDAFLLAETDRLPYSTPLSLTRYLRKEKNALPWNLFRDHVLHFEHSLDPQSPALPLLKEYVNNLTSELYDEYVASANNKSMFKKWDTKAGSCSYTYTDLDLESTLVDLACRSSNEKCLDAMHEELQLWLMGQNVTSDLHLVLDVAVAQFGNDTLWTYLTDDITKNETEKSRKFLLAEAITSFTSAKHVQKNLDLMVFDPRIDLELAKFMFLRMSNKPEILKFVWNYAAAHWDVLMDRLDARNNPSIGISIFCDKLKTVEYLGDLVRLTKRNPPASEFVIQGCMEEIQNSIEWSRKHETHLMQWLRENV